MGLQKWSTKTDTQLAPTCDECGASARDMLVHCVGWPVGVSEDLRAKLQVLGDTEAAWGSRSSTGRLNWRPWGPHITRGLSRVSPAKFLESSITPLIFGRKMCLQMKSAIKEKRLSFWNQSRNINNAWFPNMLTIHSALMIKIYFLHYKKALIGYYKSVKKH